MSIAPASPRIRIALMSDSALFRSGLRRLLGRDRAFVVSEEITEWRPRAGKSFSHILLADAQLARSLSVCRELRLIGGRPWVILVGADDDDEQWAVQALKAGVRGILAKNATVQALIKAVRVVHQGQVWASNRVIASAIEELTRPVAAAAAMERPVQDRLSPRERQVAQLIVAGLSNLETGARLGITEATVKAHLTHIFQKLALRGRGQLTARYHASLAEPHRERGMMLG
jgi:DNA-binding NarL/FixJ family response regulator